MAISGLEQEKNNVALWKIWEKRSGITGVCAGSGEKGLYKHAKRPCTFRTSRNCSTISHSSGVISKLLSFKSWSAVSLSTAFQYSRAVLSSLKVEFHHVLMSRGRLITSSFNAFKIHVHLSRIMAKEWIIEKESLRSWGVHELGYTVRKQPRHTLANTIFTG